jgi:hypothetical protein
MTQYSDLVEDQRTLNDAEEWGGNIKYIHANDGITETAYNNGDKQYIDSETGKQWTVYANHSQGTLIQKFIKWTSDRSHYGKF